jgi:hypothetical protein
MAEETKTPEQKKVSEFIRHPEFSSLYANNIQFEWSQFDLKLLFGELDQSVNPLRVEQHTAITIPWAQAKLTLYYLQLQVAFFELQNGKIKIPSQLVPPEAVEPTEEQKQHPQAEEIFKLIKAIHDQFVAGL